MKTQPTPEPWTGTVMFNGENQIQHDGYTVAIAVRQTERGDNWTGCPVANANARLIAAAPDLLEACRVAALYVDGTSEPGRKIAAAISKAEGAQ